MPHPDEPLPPPPASSPGGVDFPSAPSAPTRDPRRDPGSRSTLAIAWLATIAAVVIVIMHQSAARNAPAPLLTTSSKIEQPDALINLLGRYTLGAARLVTGAKTGTTVEPPAELLRALSDMGAEPPDALRVATVVAEVEGTKAALERLDELGKTDPLPDDLAGDIATLHAIYSGEGAALTPESRAGLRERHQWFGRLALSFGAPDSDPERAGVLAAASRTMGVLLGAAIAAIGVILLGFGVGIWALVLLLQRKIRPAYAAPTAGGSAYLEAFAIFLVGFLGVSALAGLIEKKWGIDPTFGLIWLLALCPFYPLLRGVPWRKHRFALGLHAGAPLKGRTLAQDRAPRVLREMGAGVIGYLAGIPIFLAGVLLTLLTALIVGLLSGKEAGGPPPAHPIIREIGAGGWKGAVQILVLASIWAPLVEEMMFRGCFYHHLRGKLRPILAGLGVAFVFAVIHPPGIIAVPALMSLAVVFALIREWRGSVIGCMTAHAMHNGTLLITLMIALS